MELIDRYIHEVGRHLPQKMRGDVELEIRSNIEDTLEGYAAKQGGEIDDDMIVAVLQEFGNPEKVAALYRPGQQYLIGPSLFPIFKIVASVYVIVITVLFVIGLVIGSSETVSMSESLNTVFANIVGEYWGAITGGLGSVIIIFAILERVLPPINWEDKENEAQWNPRDLPAIDDPSHLSYANLIAEIVFLLIFIAFLNVLPDKVGMPLIHDGTVEFVPLLGEGYTAYLPWINLWLGLSILLNVIVLKQGRWQLWTRWAELGVNILSLSVLYMLLISNTFLAFNPAWIPDFNMAGQDLAREMAPFFSWIMKMIIGIMMIIGSVEAVTQFYKLVFRRNDWQPSAVQLRR